MTVSRRTLARLATTLAATAALGTALPAFAADPRVKFVTSEGDFVVELYPDKAPKTVENFLQYVKDKHYDGLIFHRVIKNFMVQGGGHDKDDKQRPTRPTIKHEGREALAKGLKNLPGTIAMARTNDPHSASSQFFINHQNNSFQLDYPLNNGGYAVFGKITQGMDVVDKIAKVSTGNRGMHQNVPVEPVVMQSVKVLSDK